jgi:hypothetical protein
MPRISRPVPLTLDKPRTLVLGFNACVLIEDQTGENVLSPTYWRKVTPKRVRAALWAALLHEEDPTLTLERVGDLLTEHMDRWVEIKDALIDAWEQAMPPAPPKKGESAK